MHRAENDALLKVIDLRKHFPLRWGFNSYKTVKAVDEVSFEVPAGTTLGLVGESGCGKTTTARIVLGLLRPTSGHVCFQGRDVFSMGGGALREARKNIQMVFQDPYSSLDPRMNAAAIVSEPLVAQGVGNKAERAARVKELLDLVGLSAAHVNKYPHEFSGGQRQRVGIARALALNPRMVVCDEPVSSLDVSIQSQIINLLEDLQDKLGLAYLFISHNLSVVQHISHTVAVMYLGKIVETGPVKDIYERPVHPYTIALLSATPVPDPSRKVQRILLEGDVPSPVDIPPGCRFHTRCPRAVAQCREQEPTLELQPGDDAHYAACWRPE